MSHHDERLLAEQLDAFLDDPSATLSVHRADAATVRALAATAMEPDPAFVARLEQRLRAMPRPAPPARQRRIAWLDALLRPAGRLAWVGLLTLVVLTGALWLRALSQHPGEWGEGPAQPAPEPVIATSAPSSSTREPEATATMLDETVVTTPDAPSTPGDALTVPTPAPTATAIVDALPAPFAEGLDLSWEGWSPDGRFALYRTHTATDLAVNPQYTPGDFLVLDTQQPNRRCTQVADHRERRPHLWLNERDLLYVTDRDEVAVWPVCADERGGWTDRFPEIPVTGLAASPDRSRFIFRGATRYWLFDTATLEAQPVEGLTEEELGAPLIPSSELPVLQGHSAAWSSDGNRVAMSFHSGDSVIVDGATGALIHRVDEEPLDGLGGPPMPVWLSDAQLLIPQTRDRGPLLVTEEDSGWEITSVVETIVPGTTLEGLEIAGWSAWAARDTTSEASHIVLLGFNAQGLTQTYPLLYHSETGEVEELRFLVHEGLPYLSFSFSETGRELLQVMEWIGPNSTLYQAWFRPLDPPGAQHHLVVGSEWRSPLLSPDGRWVAAQGEAGLALFDTITGAMMRQWSLQGVEMPSWSSDSRWLLIPTQGEGREQLRLLAVGP